LLKIINRNKNIKTIKGGLKKLEEKENQIISSSEFSGGDIPKRRRSI
jgi:hypothetical protein